MKSNVVLVALSAAVLASCGTGGASSGPTTLALTPTNYVTVLPTPTTTTTTTLPGQAGNPGQVHPEEGSYVIASGDLPSTIARKFKVKFADLMSINSWPLVGQQVPECPAIGTTIRLPPGWTEPGAPADTSGGGTTPPTGTTTTLAGGKSTCAPGEYTILPEDTTRKKVADKLNTTVAELDAANAATKGYSSFYPGLKIKTPPKANC
ncbi:MAG: LysM peptidoglycan-binding domain-containing protein [Ilumatobacteraceae bacterium]